MDIQIAHRLAKNLLEKHLGDSKNDWSFKFDDAKCRFGYCSYGGRAGFFISLSEPLTLLNGEEKVRDTILHEIAHAMDVDKRGYSSHDANWREIALSIGCDGERCYDEEVVQPKSKYIITCNHCDYKDGGERKPRRKAIACGKCCKKHNNGKYTKKYKLVYTKNL